MYINELGIKEINQYYAQHGGRRTANIKNFANYIENAKAGRVTAAKSPIAASTNAAASTDNRSSAKTGTASRQAAAESQTGTEGADSQSTDTSLSGNSCCDKCQLTGQLLMRMMAGNLYTQGGLGFSAAGSGALAAYQSLSKYFGTGLFS